MKTRHKILLIISVVLVVLLSYGIYYINDYHHTQIDIKDYNNTTVRLKATDMGILLDGYGDDTALIFYPGAKVEYTSYMPLLYKLSENGVDCILIEMPLNLAILGKEKADDVLNDDSYNYTNYYIAGHSLGGAMASEYASTHKENISGLILLASYPTQKIETPTLSIYGSEDKVLNYEKYEENLKNMPSDYKEHIIQGANHAQYACYGIQENDGNATITASAQINYTADEILNFIRQHSNIN